MALIGPSPLLVASWSMECAEKCAECAAFGKTRKNAIEGRIHALAACVTLPDDASLDIVIAGHAHLPALIEVEPGRDYLSAGDWITHDSYLVLSDDGPPATRH